MKPKLSQTQLEALKALAKSAATYMCYTRDDPPPRWIIWGEPMQRSYHIRCVTMDKLEKQDFVNITKKGYYPDKSTITPAGRQYLAMLEEKP